MSKKYKEVNLRPVSYPKVLDTTAYIGAFNGVLRMNNILFVDITVEVNEDNIRITSIDNPSDVWVIEKLKTTEK